jgi:hypothetical protein
MYCSACGTFSSDADVHTCVDAPPDAAPAGWHPDPKDPTLLRYWDGATWTEHTAWASASASAGGAVPGAGPVGEHGRYLGALPRTVGRGGRFDVLVYERALVMARVPGLDPAALGFLIGFFTVSGLVGYVAGDYVGASRNGARVAELAALSPDAVAARDKRNAIVPLSSLAEAEVVTYGKSGGRMKARTTAGKRWKRRWTRPHTKDVDTEALLRASLGQRFEVRRGNSVRPYAALIALAVLVLLVPIAVAVPTFLGARDRARERSARAEIAPACRTLLALNDRANRGESINPQELVAAIGGLVPPFHHAASTSSALAPASDAAGRLDAFADTWDGSRLPQAVVEDLTLVLRTCAGQ